MRVRPLPVISRNRSGNGRSGNGAIGSLLARLLGPFEHASSNGGSPKMTSRLPSRRRTLNGTPLIKQTGAVVAPFRTPCHPSPLNADGKTCGWTAQRRRARAMFHTAEPTCKRMTIAPDEDC